MLLTYSRKSNSQRCFLADIFEGLHLGVLCNIMCTLKVTKSTCNKKTLCDINSLSTKVSSADNFANSLDPDQAQQNVGPDLDPDCLTL